MRSAPAIQLVGLTKTYPVRRLKSGTVAGRLRDMVAPRVDRVRAVDAISLSVEEGERVAFIGPNGAGKSTTLKILAGILHPDAGEARVLGLVPWRDRLALAFDIGTVFGQRSQLWYHLPPRDTFALLGRVYEVDRRRAPAATRRRSSSLRSRPCSRHAGAPAVARRAHARGDRRQPAPCAAHPVSRRADDRPRRLGEGGDPRAPADRSRTRAAPRCC